MQEADKPTKPETPDPVPCPRCESVMDPRRIVCSVCATNNPEEREALRTLDLTANTLMLMMEATIEAPRFPLGAVELIRQATVLIRENADAIRYGRDA